jgi:membrane protein implicated in regulation of membrane protease activity
MDWLVGGLTILAMELIGRKMWQGWAVGLVNQALWFYLIVYQQQLWGLAMLTVILTWRYAAALIRWRREQV